MPSISLPTTLDKIDAGGKFEPIPSGTYQLAIENVEQKKTRNNDDMLSTQFQIINDPEFTGRKVFENFVLNEKGLFKFKQFALSAGLEIADEFATEDLLNVECTAVVDIEPARDANGPKLDKDGEPIYRNVIKYFEY